MAHVVTKPAASSFAAAWASLLRERWLCSWAGRSWQWGGDSKVVKGTDAASWLGRQSVLPVWQPSLILRFCHRRSGHLSSGISDAVDCFDSLVPMSRVEKST